MRKTLLAIVIILIISITYNYVHAEDKTVKLVFDHPGGPELFRAYETTEAGKTLHSEIPGDQREFTFIQDIYGDDCHTYFLASVRDGVEAYSNTITYCPELEIPSHVQRPIVINASSITITVGGN